MGNKLIINADDFGLRPEVSDAILELAQKGCLTSTTIMANFVEVRELALLRNASLGTGLHINLIEGTPLCPAAQINTIIDRNGQFYPAVKLWKLALTGKVNPLHIEMEITAQYQFLVKNGITVSHADSHQHVHQFPRLGQMILKTLAKLGIRKIRYANPTDFYSLKMFVLKSMSRITSNSVKTFIHPDGLISFFSVYSAGKYHQLENKVSGLFQKYSCLEMMTHPSFKNIEGSYLDRKAEYECLKANIRVIKGIEKLELINYNQL